MKSKSKRFLFIIRTFFVSIFIDNIIHLNFADLIDGSGVMNCFRHLERMGSGRSNSSAGGGVGGVCGEDMSSSSLSSTDAPSSSPTASYSGENLLHFHGDSSGSL